MPNHDTHTAPIITAIYRYPVKGLSAEAMQRVELTAGQAIPFDRAFAIENGSPRFDPDAPRYLPKTHFLMLMRDERLAKLETRYDETTGVLTILRDAKPVARGDLATPAGRAIIEQFMAAFMKSGFRGAPKIVHAEGHSFSDVAAKCLHIVNLASVRDLEHTVGRGLDPLRFRPNLIIDGVTPWVELGWVGRELTAGGVRLQVTRRTGRCAATNVDPATGERNMDIPAVLARKWGHTDFGIYAKITSGGAIAVGDPVTMADFAPR